MAEATTATGSESDCATSNSHVPNPNPSPPTIIPLPQRACASADGPSNNIQIGNNTTTTRRSLAQITAIELRLSNNASAAGKPDAQMIIDAMQIALPVSTVRLAGTPRESELVATTVVQFTDSKAQGRNRAALTL